MSIIPSEQAPESGELIDLVDRYLDQRLDEAQGKRLETLLRDDPQARRYCAERIRLHSELHSLARPLRIEIHEDRNLVIEQSGGVSTVTARQSNRVSVAPSSAMVQNPGRNRLAAWWLLLPMALGLALAGWWIHSSRQDAARQQAPPHLIAALENASFEAENLKDGEIRNSVVGWETSTSKRHSAVVNPGKSRLSGGLHLPQTEAKLSSPQALSLTIDRLGEAGWVRQRLYGETAIGTKRLQLADIDGRTIRVEMNLIRPAVEGTAYAENDVFFYAGIQEELRPGRKVASYQINTGKEGWAQADRSLGLNNDQLVKVSFDLKVEVGEMRGDAFFVMGIARNSPPGGEIYIDDVSLRLLDR